jgi:hypothetical protein
MQTPQQRQVSPAYLFETIGRLTIETDLLKKENESILEQLKKESEKNYSKDTPGKTP